MKKFYENAKIDVVVINTLDIMVASTDFDAQNEDGNSFENMFGSNG